MEPSLFILVHARTGFLIEDQTYQAILRHRGEIKKCSPSRLRDEFLRELKGGVAKPTLHLMLETGLLLSLFPDLDRALGDRSLSEKKTREQRAKRHHAFSKARYPLTYYRGGQKRQEGEE
jgi:tRNA nucleotidyltransferase/poly(A) polymerase